MNGGIWNNDDGQNLIYSQFGMCIPVPVISALEEAINDMSPVQSTAGDTPVELSEDDVHSMCRILAMQMVHKERHVVLEGRRILNVTWQTKEDREEQLQRLFRSIPPGC